YELNGYPNDGSADEAITRMGRWSDEEQNSAFFIPLARLAATANAEQSKLASMHVSSFGGDYATIAAREHQQALDSTARTLATIHTIESNVISYILTWTTRAYHELLFSDLQSDLFAAAQSEIDGRLAPLTGSTLSKIESISERLRDGDTESVSQAMSTC